jgi:hypothetical protein
MVCQRTDQGHRYGTNAVAAKERCERRPGDREGKNPHPLLGDTTAAVQEVGRLAAVKLDNVHGRHGKAGAVHCGGTWACEQKRHALKYQGWRAWTLGSAHTPMQAMLPSMPM